jgi:O-antigen/teichoic acid export membrane protein
VAPSLLSNAGIMSVGQVIYSGCQWGILIALARLGGPEMVGRFALALAIAAPVMLFSNLGLRPALVTDVRGEHPFGRYLELRFATTALGLIMVVAVVFSAGFQPGVALLVVVVAFAKAFENLSDILYGVAQRHERFDLIAKSMGARGILGLLGIGAATWLTGEVIFGALALALAWALVLALYDWPMTAAWRRASRDPGAPRARLGLAWSVLPLGVAALLISLNGNLPRYVIAERFGEADLGVFAAMAYLAVAGGMLINVLGQAASPRLARAATGGDRRTYVGLLSRMLLVCALLGLLGLAVSSLLHREIMGVLYGAAFTGDSSLLVWVMVAAGMTYLTSCLGFGLTALRLFKVAPPIYALACGVNLAMCLLLVPILGLLGVILAWAGSLMINALLNLAAILWELSRRSRTQAAWTVRPGARPSGRHLAKRAGMVSAAVNGSLARARMRTLLPLS